MLLAGLLVGLIAGFLAGGRLDNLLALRLRWTSLIIGAVVLRLLTEQALGQHLAIAEQLRVPLLASAYYLLAVGLWANRARPGFALALVGTLANATVIVINRGFMPVWEPSLLAAGFDPANIASPLHVVVAPTLDVGFLLRAGPLGDVLPIPFDALRNVVSIGDVLLGLGLAFFLFASLVRRPTDLLPGPDLSRRAIATGAVAVINPRGAAAEADLIMRTSAGGAAAAIQPAIAYGGAAPPIVVPPQFVERLRRHPYVRLALNAPFSALWAGQVVSLFGDRVHQIALAFLVEQATHSAFAVGLVFVASTVPNLVFGPVAGVFVDRWDQKRVMWVSDLLRAGIVILIPVTIGIHLALVYVLVFVLTTVSIFFRPARLAVVPRLVAEDELLTANSVSSFGETLADIVGYPLASVFATMLGSALALAFWVDAATYLVSAMLILATAIPPLLHRSDEGAGGRARLPKIRADFWVGWRFLRDDAVLRANTLQAIVGQFAIGMTIALAPLYAVRVLAAGQAAPETAYGLMETAIGVGTIGGSLAVGLLGARIRRGPLVIAGYIGWGAAVALLGFTDNLPVALALSAVMGIANMAFVIPTQTLFMERTPGDLIGRVISFRFSAVFGSISLAMAVSGALGDAVGVAPIYVVFGLATVVAGAAGLASRPLRTA